MRIAIILIMNSLFRSFQAKGHLRFFYNLSFLKTSMKFMRFRPNALVWGPHGNKKGA